MLSGKQVRARALTATNEHYLRALYEVHSRRGYARMTDVARELGLAPATTSVGLRALEERGLLEHDDHRFLRLTPAGERVAREVHHRFAVTRAFLLDVLGVPEERANQEACLLEHDLSHGTTDRILDLVKLLRDDHELREVFERRFAAYRRSCEPASACSTCALGCLPVTIAEERPRA